jgi:hypothetical protein
VWLYILSLLFVLTKKGTERANKPNSQTSQIIQLRASTPSGANQSNSQTSQTYKLTKAWKYLHGCPNGFPMLTYCASVRGSNISLSRLPHIVQSHLGCPALAAFCSVELSTLLYPRHLQSKVYLSSQGMHTSELSLCWARMHFCKHSRY